MLPAWTLDLSRAKAKSFVVTLMAVVPVACARAANDEYRLVEESGSLRYILGELCIDAISLCRL